MLRLWLIRHGMTEGNRYGRYIGVTDQPLCEEGRQDLRQLSYPRPQAVFVSPMKRCVETAHIFFPDFRFRIIDDLAECDFGDFENKNYEELSGNPDYQAWVDSNCILPIPNGESMEIFHRRAIRGFQRAVISCIRGNITEAAFVIHGGTIMSILSEYAKPSRPFYEWHVKNGGGYEAELDPLLWKKDKRELHIRSAVRAG